MKNTPYRPVFDDWPEEDRLNMERVAEHYKLSKSQLVRTLVHNRLSMLVSRNLLSRYEPIETLTIEISIAGLSPLIVSPFKRGPCGCCR